MIDRRQSNGSGERAMTSSTSGAAGGRRGASGRKKDATRKVDDLDLESIDSRKRRKVSFEAEMTYKCLNIILTNVMDAVGSRRSTSGYGDPGVESSSARNRSASKRRERKGSKVGERKETQHQERQREWSVRFKMVDPRCCDVRDMCVFV